MTYQINRYYREYDHDLPDVSLDLHKKTLVTVHRSTRHQQEQSELLLEQLVSFAREMRGEETNNNIIVYTAYRDADRQDQETKLLEDIASGTVGSVVVERPDRLVRDQHSLAARVMREQQIIVIIPGGRKFNLSNEDNWSAFQIYIQEANNRPRYHISIMRDTQAREILLREEVSAETDQEAITLAQNLTHQFTNGSSQKEALLLKVTKTIHQERLIRETGLSSSKQA